ncbi:FtsQ-type POTRA domain-containing protein [Actinomyces sp. zg-332]|uniref:cell division protein FtsQ/DivIB n=1 Tax=Actinomyces sp. zg-332 TaxID=2708340 RepID=UPI001420BDBE|nr:FtsQ-type POTRA domain-containing protein [Actinomyces sp. zg-332]QPK94429.1 FtsQ-type POTRA domain-containing protein [Actinomyces sp. zg-332]
MKQPKLPKDGQNNTPKVTSSSFRRKSTDNVSDNSVRKNSDRVNSKNRYVSNTSRSNAGNIDSTNLKGKSTESFTSDKPSIKDKFSKVSKKFSSNTPKKERVRADKISKSSREKNALKTNVSKVNSRENADRFYSRLSGFSFKTFYENFTYHPHMENIDSLGETFSSNTSDNTKSKRRIFKTNSDYKRDNAKRELKDFGRSKVKSLKSEFFPEINQEDKNIKFDIPITDTKILKNSSVSGLEDSHTILIDNSEDTTEDNAKASVEEVTSFQKYVEYRKDKITPNLSFPNSIKYISKPINNVTHSLRDRLVDNKKKLRITNLKKFSLWGLGALSICILGYLVYGSSLFSLDKSEIALLSKPIHVQEKDLRTALNDYVDAPLPSLSSAALESEIERKFVWVKKAKVSKQWPNGLAVSLVEREGVAVAKNGNSFVLLDPTGRQLETLDKPQEGIPLVDIPLNNKKTKESLNAVLNVLGAVPAKERAVVVQAKASDKDNVEFELQGGIKVIWGSNSDNKLKAKVLEILRGKQAKIIDVSTPSKPVTIL